MPDCVVNHTAMIFDRGGTRRYGPPLFELTKVAWDRRRDSISEASIRIEGDACSSQAAFLSSIRTHRHELVIFRGNQRVWEGPIGRTTIRGTYAEIHANDVLAYVKKTPMTKVYDNTYEGAGVTEVTTRIGNIIAYELSTGRIQKDAAGFDFPVPAWESLDPPVNIVPHLVIHHFPNEARTSSKTLAYQMTVGDHLQQLARTSGIDFTVVGRAIHIWDVSRSIGEIGTMTEANFYSDVAVSEYGADHAQASYTVGQSGTYGSALNTENLDYYGPWTTIFTAYNEEPISGPSQAELDSQSKRNLSGRSPAPIEVRVPDNSSVILTDTLTINDLVPGVRVPLRATLNARQLAQTQKIDNVKVVETSKGETVQLVLTPTTKADEDVEEP
jgi:hypothetical protein